MPRIARVVAIGLPHHITQRGNYRQDVFKDNKDRENYLLWIQECCERFGVLILAYCLMSNHVHFIAVPKKENSLAKVFNTAHMKYSHYFNKKLKAAGHLWQGRFYSCVLDDGYLAVCAKYIERNPVRAKIVKYPWQWKWSSAGEHTGSAGNSIIKLADLFQAIDVKLCDWKGHISHSENKVEVDELRKHTLTGRPLGETEFIKKLEKLFDRRLIALPRGRPITLHK